MQPLGAMNNPTGGRRKDGKPKSFLTLKTKVQLYEELKVMLEADPQNEGCVRYRAGLSEPKVVEMLSEKIPEITTKNVESLRKELFGPLARYQRPGGRKEDADQRIEDLEQQVELLQLEIESINRKLGKIMKEIQLDAENTSVQGDFRRA